MAIQKKTTPATPAGTQMSVAATPETATASTPLSEGNGKKRGPKPGSERGESFRWTTEAKEALVIVLKRIDRGKLPGAVTASQTAAYLSGEKPLPPGNEDLQERLASLEGRELLSDVRVIAGVNSLKKAAEKEGETLNLPVWSRSRGAAVDVASLNELE